jgi:hypothetical protein
MNGHGFFIVRKNCEYKKRLGPAMGIHCADHATPSIRQSWKEVPRQVAVGIVYCRGSYPFEGYE